MKSGRLARSPFARWFTQNDLVAESESAMRAMQLGGLALPASTPRPPRFGQVSTKNRSKSNSDKRLHPRSLPANGFILARSEGRLPTVMAGGVGNLANCPGDWRAGLATWQTALVIGGRGWQVGWHAPAPRSRESN